MGLFKKNNEPRKQVYTKNVMHQDGLPNFLNDVAIQITIDEVNSCIKFSEAKKKGVDKNSASLDFSKITQLIAGEKGNVTTGNSTGGAIAGAIVGGTTGAVIGSTIGKTPAFIPTLTIRYRTENGEKDINLYQCNFYSEGSIAFIKSLIESNLTHSKKTHIEL